MNKSLFCLLPLMMMTLTTQAALEPGAVAPKFQARASLNGQEFDYSLQASLANGPVVVYFYPSAYTHGCNIQAHTFSENMDAFKAAGASVIGVSLDSIERLNDFSADPDYCAGKLAVASDPEGDIARSFGLSIRENTAGAKDSRGIEIGHDRAERVTFIVTPDGKISETVGGVSPMENVEKTLEVVQRLQK